MSQKTGHMLKRLSRFFRERQIYHRSDGVVRFVKLSSQMQIAMVSILGVTLCWVAYSSVHFVFKEQVIKSEQKEKRNIERAYQNKLSNAERAYDDINALNVIFSREFDAAVSQLESRHETLRSIVQNKSEMDKKFEELSSTLSEVGDPKGNQIKNGNRIMVDPVGREPTPRQSREARIHSEALEEVMNSEITAGLENDVLIEMREKTARLTARQMVLMAQVEAEIREQSREMKRVLTHTGVDNSKVLAKARITQTNFAANNQDEFSYQGGPAILENNPTSTPSVYYKAANRIQSSMDELRVLTAAIETIPLSSPTTSPHRKSSFFGVRWDPFKKSVRARHEGVDFKAGYKTPVVATAPGRVAFAGVRGGYGNTVEIDHGNGFVTRYAHLNRIKVRSGAKVNLHDTIGLLGNSGRSTGPHIHYEVIFNGKKVDPMRFIEAGRYVFES